MNYTETLDFLFTKLPMYQRVGSVAMKKNLDNIKALCSALGSPEKDFKSIHIAGTNGKGSITHILASILQEHGLNVGCYTSPHYIDFRERIKINGALISEDAVVDFVSKNKRLIEELQPSFFEITVALSFKYFSDEKVDVAIIETGLGGRLDSTNIITPLLSIISNISFDHQAMLGNTLEEIAGEKSGIIKTNIPALLGEDLGSINQVFLDKAKEENATLNLAYEMIQIHNFESTLEGSTFQIHLGKKRSHFRTDLIGTYQLKNIRTSMSAIQLLQSTFPVTQQQIQLGLENVRSNTHFLGRLQKISDEPLAIVDSAHNEAGLEAIIHELNGMDYEQLHFVYGTVNDKDLSQILPLLPTHAQFYFCKPDVPRGLDEHELLKVAQRYNLKGKSFPSVRIALKAAESAAKKNDLIVISGSIFVVGEVL